MIHEICNLQEMCLRLKILGKASSEATTPETSRESPFPGHGTLNLSDEYANTVKTKSYEAFREQAYGISRQEIEENGQASDHSNGFREELLHPDQKSVNAIIIQHKNLSDEPELRKLITDYFNSSKDAYKICGILHKNIESARRSYGRVQNILGAMPTAGGFSEEQCHSIVESFELYVEADNPFAQIISENIDNCFRDLLKQMKLGRNKVRTKLKCVDRYFFPALCVGSAIFLPIFAVVSLLAGPDAVCFPVNFGRKRLVAWEDQRKLLDIAVRGCYVVSNHVDTMSRLVTPLHNKIEQNKLVMRCCLHRSHERYLVEEVAMMLNKNNNYIEQLHELEEYVCVCWMTINRSRMLLFEEILKQQNRV